MANLLKVGNGDESTVTPEVLVKNTIPLFFSDTEHCVTLEAKAEFIAGLVHDLEDLEHQTGSLHDQELFIGMVGGVGGIAAYVSFGFSSLFPPIGFAIMGAVAVSTVGSLVSSFTSRNQLNDTKYALQKLRLVLQSADAIQWAKLWHYDEERFGNALKRVSTKAIVQSNQLVGNNNKCIIAATKYIADCRGISKDELIQAINSMPGVRKPQATVPVREERSLPPVQATRPEFVESIEEDDTEEDTSELVSYEPTRIQQPETRLQYYSPDTQLQTNVSAVNKREDIVDLILNSIYSLVFIGGQRVGKSRLMAIAYQHGLKLGYYTKVSVISVLSKPDEDPQYWQHAHVQKHCDLSKVVDRTSYYIQFFKIINDFMQTSSEEEPQLLIIDEFAYLSQQLTQDTKDKVREAVDLGRLIICLMAANNSAGEKNGRYIWLGTPEARASAFGDFTRVVMGLGLVYCALKPGVKVIKKGKGARKDKELTWDINANLFVDTKRNFSTLYEPSEKECLYLDDRIVFFGGCEQDKETGNKSKWLSQTSYELSPLQDGHQASTQTIDLSRQEDTTYKALDNPLLEETRQKLENSAHKYLWDVAKHDMNVWDNERVKLVVLGLAKLILDNNLDSLKEKFNIHSLNDVRYSYKGYRKALALTHQATNSICCCCLENQSVNGHHTSYEGEEDKAGANLYGLCKPCHDLSHRPENWDALPKKSIEAVWGNRSTVEWKAKLDQGYQMLSKRGVLGNVNQQS